jgi:hypothetical protein
VFTQVIFHGMGPPFQLFTKGLNWKRDLYEDSRNCSIRLPTVVQHLIAFTCEKMDQRTNWTSDLESFPKGSVADSLIHAEAVWDSLCLTEDPRWQLAQRVVASKSFAKSALLSKFLLYVCDRALSGRTDEISENQIGVHVFVRKPGYNPGEDNIVRNYARQVRQRLDHYFEEEGKSEELRISIPLGKYIPVFSPNRSEQPAPVPAHHKQEDESVFLPPAAGRGELPPIPPPLPRDGGARLYALFALFLVMICGIAGWKVVKRDHSGSGDPCHPLWSQVFDKDRQTFVVPSDDGIVMFQNLTGHSVHLEEYINRNYLSVKSSFKIDAQNLADLDAQRYTNIADLDAVLKFSRVPEANPAHFVTRYARELHMEDLKDSNAVLLGSTYSNPWVELFQKSLNFEFNYEPHPNASFIVNKHPVAGEASVYSNDATAPSHRTYAVVALVPNLNNTGWILIIEGLTMAGTQAATDILFNREEMRSVMERAAANNGKLKPFEVLIETRSFGSNSPQANIIASRIYSKLPIS